MEGLGRSIGESISGAFDNAASALGAAVEGLIASLGTLPGGWLWLVGLVALVLVAWRLVR